MKNKIIFITGGARSGKSAFAEKLASHLCLGKKGEVAYIATGVALDEEFQRKNKETQREKVNCI